MVLNYPIDEISLSPFKGDGLRASFASLKQDLGAAIAVAFLTFPQAMAYALVAGLPLQCGLFAATYGALIAALFGSSRHLVVGPSNAIAILIQAGTSALLFTYYRDLPGAEREIVAIQILTQITILTALLQILVAWCRLGRLMQFVSHSVVVGYITGTALAMFTGQLYVFLGVTPLPGVHSLYEHSTYLLTHPHFIQWPTAAIGAISLLLLTLLKRFERKIPIAVICFAVSGFLVYFLGLSSLHDHAGWVGNYFDQLNLPPVRLIGDTGEVGSMLPNLAFPDFNIRMLNGVFPIACAIALISMMETTSVAKSIAASSGQRLSVNQEILGIGLGNLLSGFIGGMPLSGSPSRTTLNYQFGGQSKCAAIFSALCVALTIALFGFLLQRIPLAALAALLLVTSTRLVNKNQFLLCIKATNADAFVLWTTLLSCIFFSLDISFYIGIGLSIVLYLKKAAVPHLVEYEIGDHGELRQATANSPAMQSGIRMIKVEGELFFGSADLFQTTLKTFAEDDKNTRIIILQLKNARDIDATTCLALEQLYKYLKGSDRHLIACGLTLHIWEVLSNSGLVDLLGKDNLFIFDERHPQQHMQYAIQHAKRLLGDPLSSQKEPSHHTPLPIHEAIAET